MVGANQLFNCMDSVASDCRENFLRDREDVPPRFIREAVIEDTCFTRPDDVTLNNHRSIDRLEILQSCAH